VLVVLEDGVVDPMLGITMCIGDGRMVIRDGRMVIVVTLIIYGVMHEYCEIS